MLGMQAQHDVQHARFLSRELAIGTQHGQDGLGRGLTGNEAMHDHGAVIVSSLLRVVGQHMMRGRREISEMAVWIS